MANCSLFLFRILVLAETTLWLAVTKTQTPEPTFGPTAALSGTGGVTTAEYQAVFNGSPPSCRKTHIAGLWFHLPLSSIDFDPGILGPGIPHKAVSSIQLEVMARNGQF